MDQIKTAQDMAAAFDVFQRIRQSEGDKIRWELELLRTSYQVFSWNFDTLKQIIQNFERPEVSGPLMAVEKRALLDAVQTDIIRHLHNFLCGANTLIDHTRVFAKRRYAGDPFLVEYQAKVDATFKASGFAGLVKGMRNWMVHRDILPVTIVTSITSVTEERFTSFVSLNINQLAAYDGWNTHAKALLAAFDPKAPPRLLEIVQSYYEEIVPFYTWLEKRMQEVHADVFAELAELQRQYAQIMK